MPSSRGPSWPKDWTWVFLCLLHWQPSSLLLVLPGKTLSPNTYTIKAFKCMKCTATTRWLPGAGILHIEWGSVIAQLEFYHCREPAWGTPPMTKVMRKEARHTQRRDRASGVPLEILEHLPPKPESAYFLFCAFTYTSDFTGGCLPLPLSEKRVSLQLQLVIPGCDSV